MIKINNKEKVIEELNENKLENVFNIVPNLSDKVLDYNEENFEVTNIINEVFEDKRKYKSDKPVALFVMAGIQSRMKQQFSISELSLALTSKEVINKLNLNIVNDTNDSILKEANIRAWLHKNEQENKEQLDFNDEHIKIFNKLNEKYLEKTDTNCNIHILDCSILDVNISNNNYEGSSITYKGNKKLRGYKIGMLRGITNNGGVVEEICMGTAKEHDLSMSENMILNTKYLKKGDFLLEDRGFIDIDIFEKLDEKGIFVILPVKKNMEIFIEAIKCAKNKNEWSTHPNENRKGQDITLITNLEECWISSKNKNKKPSKFCINYKINACVIRFDKSKNKKVLSDDEIIYSDDKYAYACIITNNVDLTCAEIVRMYETRPEIEEDFRQLKDFWGLNTYKSTKYHIISFIILVTLMGYNFYQIYKESEEGKNYIGKSLIVEERHGLYIVKGVRTAIVTKRYFAIFEQEELLDLYAELNKEKRKLLKQFLVI